MVADWARERDLLDLPDVRSTLAELTAVFRVNELLNWEVARAAAVGEISVGDASSSKAIQTERRRPAGFTSVVRAAEEEVHSGVAGDRVVAETAVHDVVAGTGVDGVIAAVAEDPVAVPAESLLSTSFLYSRPLGSRVSTSSAGSPPSSSTSEPRARVIGCNGPSRRQQ